MPGARHCLQAYYDELDRRFAAGFDPQRSRQTAADDMRPPAGAFLVATRRGEAVGCGALKFHPDGVTELKRLWVDRRQPVGSASGGGWSPELEAHAAAHGATRVRLDTNASAHRGDRPLPPRPGTARSAPFNDEAYADHWFEKRLDT